jgi:hypothetical protein
MKMQFILAKMNYSILKAIVKSHWHLHHPLTAACFLTLPDLNTFTLNFSTNSFKAGEKIETVYYALETVTEDTYRYLVVKEKQAYASQNGISDPVINYTNMVNGYGFIGGSSKAVDSLVIK